MDSKQIESAIPPPINIHFNHNPAEIGVEKEKYSNEWITKLRTMLEADVPISKNKINIPSQKNTEQ